MIRYTKDRTCVFLAGTNRMERDDQVDRQYVCGLVADGYRIRITVFTSDRSKVEALARQRASERMKQAYGIEKAPAEFVVFEITEKILH